MAPKAEFGEVTALKLCSVLLNGGLSFDVETKHPLNAHAFAKSECIRVLRHTYGCTKSWDLGRVVLA